MDPLPEVVAAGPPFGYRERAKLAVGPGGTLGFRARRSHDVVDVPACPLFGARAGARAAGAARRRRAGWRRASSSTCRRAATASTSTSSAPTRPARRTRGARSTVWRRRVSSAWRWRASRRSGAPDVDVAEPGSPPLRVPADGFAQVGRAGNAALVAAVMEAVGASPGVVLELYAGSGNLTRHLVARARRRCPRRDGDPAAVERGARNVPGASWSLRPPARRRRHRRARPAARGGRPRAPDGGVARAPPDRLRVVRSADAGARRAHAGARRAFELTARSRWT